MALYLLYQSGVYFRHIPLIKGKLQIIQSIIQWVYVAYAVIFRSHQNLLKG